MDSNKFRVLIRIPWSAVEQLRQWQVESNDLDQQVAARRAKEIAALGIWIGARYYAQTEAKLEPEVA